MMDYQIYKIENKVNGKFYIGVTKSKYRFSSHKSNARRGRNLPLCNAMRKYGEENFEFTIFLIPSLLNIYPIHQYEKTGFTNL